MVMVRREIAKAIRRYSQEAGPQYGVPSWFGEATKHLADWRQVGGFVLVYGGALVSLNHWVLMKHVDAKFESVRADIKVTNGKIDAMNIAVTEKLRQLGDKINDLCPK
jgi:hypothetical protein